MSKSHELISILMHFIKCQDELIKHEDINLSVGQTLNNCFDYCTNTSNQSNDLKVFEVNSVLDFLYEELNTGHWSSVPVSVRRCFSSASFVKCLLILKRSETYSVELLQKCLKCLDLGLLLGAPLLKNLEFLTSSAKYITEEIHKVLERDDSFSPKIISIKRKLDDIQKFIYEHLSGNEISCTDCPSLEYFNAKYFTQQVPVKLKGCMKHWPATKKWIDINYLLNIAGDRTVPVEIGSHYADENWSQKLMTLKEFITNHYLEKTKGIGYLAQHDLFEQYAKNFTGHWRNFLQLLLGSQPIKYRFSEDYRNIIYIAILLQIIQNASAKFINIQQNQIPELKEDIYIPDYCCLSVDYENVSEPDLNAWLGPKGTISPLHHDPKNNLLAQVYGAKQVILFSPQDSQYLYPHEGSLLSNTAKVNPVEPDLEKYPEYSRSTMYKCLLEPGEMVFIPAKWWHHVTALDKSFSVSFWWQ